MKISKEFKVASLAIGSIVILYFGFNYLKGIDMFQTTNDYYVLYQRVEGLKKSNPVIINGYSVGRVNDIRILQQNGNLVLVDLNVDSDINIGVGTVARLMSTDFLGSKAIELNLVDSTGRYYEDGDTLASSFDEGITGLLKEKAGPVADTLAIILNKLNIILDGLAKNTDKISGTIENLEGFTGTLNANLPELMAGLKTNSNEISELMAGIKPILSNTTQLTDSLKTLELSATLTKAQLMLDNMNARLQAMKEGEGTMGKLMTDDSLYFYLSNTARDLDRLFVDLEANPGRYVQFSLFGKKDKTEKEKN